MNYFQSSLNAYRLSTIKLELNKMNKTREIAYRTFVYKNKIHLHNKPRDALHYILCPNGDVFSVPSLKCIL